ncbi:hypothetical protein ColTof4_11891 [Colletotrichum tofieldiae]|nr:hypothetical protein ColTof4_11891 [Colletotrichum tofieldiae]
MSPAMLLLYGPFVIRTKTCQWGASLESTSMRQGADGEQVGGPLLGVGGEGVVPLESRDADVGAGGVVGVEGGLLVGGQAGGAAGGGARGGGGGRGSRDGGGGNLLLDGGDDGGRGHGRSGGRGRDAGGGGDGDSGGHGAPVAAVVAPAPVGAGGTAGPPGGSLGGEGGNSNSGETHFDSLGGGFG